MRGCCARAQSCRDRSSESSGKFYILAGAEGLSAIGDSLERLDRFYDFGVRHAMLTWNEENLLASGAKGDLRMGSRRLAVRSCREWKKSA